MSPGEAAAAAFRHRVEEAIQRDDPLELEGLVLDVALEGGEREWAEACCAQLARHRSALVRGNAVLGLGHLARRFGQLDPRRTRRLVAIALCDRSDYVRGQAESAARDLETFLRWSFEP
jgi:hypothetical protein